MPDTIQILYIDDYDLDRELVRDSLEKEHGGFVVSEAKNEEEFMNLLHSKPFDLVLSDFNIAGFEGLRVLDVVKKYNPGLPVIIVTGTGSEEIAVMAMKHGAADYVIKRPKHILKLPQTIFSVLEKQRLIDRRREYERSLQINEKRFRALFDNMLNGYAYCRLLSEDGKPVDYIFIDVNRAFESATGLSGVVGKKVSDIIPGIRERDPGLFEFLGRVVQTGEPEAMEIYVKSMAEWFSITVYRPEEGHFVTIFDVVTHRKQMDQVLRESLQRLKFHVENSPLGLVEFNKAFQIIHWSGKAESVFGWCAEEVLGKGIDEFRWVHEDDAAQVRELVLSMSDSRNTSNIHINRNYRKDGSVITCEWYNSALIDGDGQLVSIQSLVLDITDRKRLEDELLRSQKLESVGILAGGIAHDFNNILAAIKGNTTLAKDLTAPGDEIHQLLGEVETATTRAQALTLQLLTFSKGGAPLKETAPIKNILKESTIFVLRGSKAHCEFAVDDDLWPADIDVGQISQAINNIVINANHAMPRGGTIRVVATNLVVEDRADLPLKPGRYIRIAISDEGVGIADEHRINIFDPYFTTKQTGSGLGLATTYSIIKKHDGHITVDSRPGAGSTFHIYLPASDKAVPEPQPQHHTPGKGRILFMDDEASLRKLVNRMMQNLGYHVESATDGDEAIRMARDAVQAGIPFDVVILDLTVPGGMGGKEAIKHLREIDPDIKAIVSSGYSNDPVLSNYEHYGFQGIATKPFDFKALSKILQEIITPEII